MKLTNIFQVLAAIILASSATGLTAQENNMNDQTASFIPMSAAVGQTEAFANFLSSAAPLVEQTEPGTKLWIALQQRDTLAIFDVFTDEDARNAHFSGSVAAALNENAGTLVEGGWEDGVVANIDNSRVLSIKPATNIHGATTATYIEIEAVPGRSEELAELLTKAGPLVAETEPQTLFWVGLQLDENRFAIFDAFAEHSGREAHFAGQVAGLLMDRSPDLVRNGWEQGVVANVNNFDILSMAVATTP